MREKWDCRMPDNFDMQGFLNAIVKQDAEKLRGFFAPGALIIWANTNEQFTVDEYIRANCEYPGEWSGSIEDWHIIADNNKRMVFIAKVWNAGGVSCRTVSFIEFSNTDDKLIQRLVEYWGDIEAPPQWRQKMNIGIGG